MARGRIETAEEFGDWARRVNTAQFKHLADLQDEFARSDTAQLLQWFIELEAERELLVFSVQKAMGSRMLLDFMQRYAREKAEERLREEDERLDIATRALEARERVVEREKKRCLQENLDLRGRLEGVQRQYEQLQKRNRELHTEIGELVLARESRRQELEKLRAFETHIKELLAKGLLGKGE